MATILLDTVDLEEASFQQYLKEHNITAESVAAPENNMMGVKYTGGRNDLEAMIWQWFVDGDREYLVDLLALLHYGVGSVTFQDVENYWNAARKDLKPGEYLALKDIGVHGMGWRSAFDQFLTTISDPSEAVVKGYDGRKARRSHGR